MIIEIERSIGKGKSNYKHDVAIIQLALKNISYSKGIYYTDAISGQVSESLYEAIKKFEVEHEFRSEEEPKGSKNIYKKNDPVTLLPNSPVLKKMNQLLRLRVHKVASIRHTSILYVIESSFVNSTAKPQNCPVPNEFGAMLFQKLETLLKAYSSHIKDGKKIRFSAQLFDVTSDFRYKLSLVLQGVSFLNKDTGQRITGIPSDFIRIIKADLPSGPWTFGGHEKYNQEIGMFFLSKQKAPFSGTSLIVPAGFEKISLNQIQSLSSDKIIRKMILVVLLHVFDSGRRLGVLALNELMNVLQRHLPNIHKDLAYLISTMSGLPLSNGCGAEDGIKVPDFPLGYNFLEPCNKHDKRYTYINWSKEEADEAFEDELLEVVSKQSWMLRSPQIRLVYYHMGVMVAELYKGAVSKLGHDAYREAQEEAWREGYLDPNKPFDPRIYMPPAPQKSDPVSVPAPEPFLPSHEVP
ncbi:hypothetical protein [Kordiimonas pumila]|uniref:Uncharacterized protein n=1 Tax=Kordiimonas pumila TaxID=2161677 RepID=A0ABV7D453_9PROT|nr:hypothetical protein [Kordiimonas pumila]